jgi:hypothetical protein
MDGSHLMKDLMEFFESFAPAFVPGCDQLAADSGFESPAWYYLPAPRLCFAFVASCCWVVIVISDRYFPDDLNISKAWLPRLKDYIQYPVFRYNFHCLTVC